MVSNTAGRIRVLLGITGGIAAYKMPDLVRLLIKNGCDVKVVITTAGCRLVSLEALQVVSSNKVYTDSPNYTYDIDHISLAKWADVFCIVPATANTIAKITYGLADNILTTTALAFKGPLLIAPAMNTAMWEHETVKTNCTILANRGCRILPVGNGLLACGDLGAGKLASLETLVEHILFYSALPKLSGRNVVITLGPTSEPVDPVRVITNSSTGKMGQALAYAAHCMGAEVTLISGLAPLSIPEGSRFVKVTTSAEMSHEVKKIFPECDICIMAAAISDYTVSKPSESKMKREEMENLTLQLTATEDISRSLSAMKKTGQILVCFALEDKMDHEKAFLKMDRKGADFLILNTVSESLGKDSTTVSVLSSKERKILASMTGVSKRTASHSIMNLIADSTGYGK